MRSTWGGGSPRRDRGGGRRGTLDPPATVDEVEEADPPHLPTPEDAAGDAALLGPLDAGLEPLGLGAHVAYRVAVGEAPRRHRPKPRRSVSSASSRPEGRGSASAPPGRPRTRCACRTRGSPRCW